MTTKDFDDAIRRKIESVNYDEYSNAEVDKIYKHVNQKRQSDKKRRFGLFSLALLSVTFIGGLIGWNVFQLNKTSALETTIDSLKYDLTNLRQQLKLVKRDTIYIREYASVSNTNSEKNIRNTSSLTEEELITLLKNYTNKKQKQPTVLKNNVVENHERKSRKKISSITENKVAQPTETFAANSVLKSDNQKEAGTTMGDSSSTAKELINPKISQTDSNEVGVSENTDSTEKPVHSFINFKKFDYQVGIGGDVANRQIGAGVFLGVQLSKHWNVQVGFKSTVMDNETFDDENDFRRRREREFKHEYGMNGPDTNFISHIGIKNRVFQIPVSVNYLQPLRNNFNLLLGLGSDLDLYANQRVNYGNKYGQFPSDDRKINVNVPVLVFNNVTINAGVEKRWNHFSLQLSPFISPQLTNVSYRKERMYYGAKLRIFYTL